MNETSWLAALSSRWGRGWQEQEAVWRWKEVVGENLSRLARPLYVEQGVLHIAVPSPVVTSELRLWEKEILTRLKKVAAASAVQKLRFHLVTEVGESAFPRVEPGPQELNRADGEVPENIPSALRDKLVGLLAQVLAQEAAVLAAGGRRCQRCGVAFLGEEEELCPLCRILP